MKRTTENKSKKWIWLVAALAAVLVILGVVLAVFLGGGQQAADPTGRPDLYWNIDKDFYMENSDTGLSMRQKAEDGMYHLRFAHDGEQVELICADKRLVNYIDNMYVMGLVFDTDGQIIEAKKPDEVATVVAGGFYVSRVEGNTVTFNSSIAMNGMEAVVQILDSTGVYDVSADAEVVGQKGQCDVMDQVYAYSDAQGNLTHVFIAQRAPEAEIYWRVEQQYDSSKGQTARVPDGNGAYTMLFAHNGEQVELKTKDIEIANEVDAISRRYAVFAFQFDEEGYIIASVSVPQTLRGKSICTDAFITEINGDVYTVRGASGGENNKVFTFTLPKDQACDIFMTCEGCYKSHIGERTDYLKVGDRIRAYSDMDGNAKLIYVVDRMVDSPMYYLLERKYSWKTNETTRVPDEKGYYHIEMLADGKKVTLKCKDKDLVSQIDYSLDTYHSCMGLEVEGNIIKRMYKATCVSGNYLAGHERYITAAMGSIVTIAAKTDFTNTFMGVLAPDCKIYDVSGYPGTTKGDVIKELRVNDQVTAFLNPDGEVEYMYVLNRYVEGAEIYYNVGQQYSGALKSTTRVPDAEGYYVYTMIKNGKEVTLKTKSKDLATEIDKQWPTLVALTQKNGIIKGVYPVSAAIPYSYKTTNTHYVNKIDKEEGTFTTYYVTDGVRTDPTAVNKLAKDCKIYNVSTNFNKNRGEKTTLQPDDQIQSIAVNPKGEIVEIYVLSRKVDSPLYWNVNRQYNTTDKVTTRQPNADGYYVFDLAVNGAVKQFKTKDKAIASDVDRYTVPMALVTDGDIILKALSPIMAKGIHADAASNFDIMEINGKKLKLVRNNPSAFGSNYGEEKELELADKYTVYDISAYAEKIGAPAQLKPGDRVQLYSDIYGKVVACFITYRNTHEKGHVSYCEHCDKEVFWNPYTSSISADVDAHYYLTHDYTAPWQGTVGTTEKNVDAVLDLNGHTMTSSKRAMLVYGTLSIVDTVGGGEICALTNTDSAVSGGCILVMNSGVVNLYGGKLTVAETEFTPANGGIVNIDGTEAVFNMYGGEVAGGTAVSYGGNFYVRGTLNIADGKIEKGTAGVNGNNIYIARGGKLDLSGGTVAGDVLVHANGQVSMSGAPKVTKGSQGGLHLMPGVQIKLGKLSTSASVALYANGVFTTKISNAEGYTSCFVPTNPKATVVADNGVLRCVAPGTLDLDADGKAMCDHCGEIVQWTAADPNGLSTIADGKHHHLYLGQNVNITWGYGVINGATTLCLHLNGNTINQTSRIFVYGDSTLNIMGEGTVTSSNTGSNSTGCITAGMGTVNIYGGTYVSATEDVPAININHSTSSVHMLTGKVQGGVDVNAGDLYLGGDAEVDSIYVTAAGTLNMKDSFVGEASVRFAGFTEGNLIPAYLATSDGAFTGTLKLEGTDYTLVGVDGRLLVVGYTAPNSDLTLDAEGKAMCQACGQKVKWTEASTTGYGELTDGKHHHVFLKSDVNITWSYLTLGGSTKMCLHLNGYDINQTGRIQTYGTLNIMGNGTVTSSSTSATFVAALNVSGGTTSIYGGTYTCTATNGAPAVATTGANAVLNLHGGTVEDDIHINNGKLVVKQTFSGTATVAFEGVTGDAIPAIRGEAEGEFPGKLYLKREGNPELNVINGRLVIGSGEAANGKLIAADAAVMTFPTTGSSCTAVCPIHGEVTWNKANTGAGGVSDGGVHHYYLTSTFDYTWGFITVEGGSEACIHLNGQTIKQGTRIIASGTGSKVNIMGSGTVLGNGSSTNDTSKTGTITVMGGTANLYGGTYLSSAVVSGKIIPVISLSGAGSKVNVYSGVVIDGSYDVDGDGTADQFTQSIRATAGEVNLYGGTVQNGQSASGGNIFASNTAVNIHEEATVQGGKATSQGGNIHVEGGAVLTTAGQIIGGQTTGSSAHGGNISATGSATVVNITGGVIRGGIAAGQGGNLRAVNVTVNMTGGEIYGGESQANVTDNVWVAGSGKMIFTGGTVKGTAGTTDYGTAIAIDNSGAGGATLYLGGTASAVQEDGSKLGCIRIGGGTAELRVLNDWTGTASVKWTVAYSYGDTVAANYGQCGSLTDNTFTAGGSFTGTLTNENGDPATVTGVDGALVLAQQ